MLPNFIIIGAQKSATTFVHRCLEQHPDVFMPEEEIRSFEDPYYSESALHELEQSLEAGRDKKLVGIKRPAYLHREECAERIFNKVPNAKLIAILRDPVVRAISAYYFYAKLGLGPITDINKALLDVLAGQDKFDAFPRVREIIKWGFYYKELRRYLNYFKAKQMLILPHDQVKTDPMGSYRKICAFLEIDPAFIPKSINVSANSGLYSLPRLRIRSLANQFRYAYSSDGRQASPKKNRKVMEQLCVFGSNFLDKFILAKIFGNKQAVLSNELLHKLSQLYIDDAAKLEQLLGINLRNWKVFKFAEPSFAKAKME